MVNDKHIFRGVTYSSYYLSNRRHIDKYNIFCFVDLTWKDLLRSSLKHKFTRKWAIIIDKKSKMNLFYVSSTQPKNKALSLRAKLY